MLADGRPGNVHRGFRAGGFDELLTGSLDIDNAAFVAPFGDET
jgi:hypothetical protein